MQDDAGSNPPGFYVYPEATASWVGDGQDIAAFCETFLRDPAQADVLEKLAQSEADERHVVVIATFDQFGLHTAVDMGLVPPLGPGLDRRVDWLWVIAAGPLPVRGCFWSRLRGWGAAVVG